MKVLVLAHEACPLARLWDGPGALLPLPGGTPLARALAIAACGRVDALRITLHHRPADVERALAAGAAPAGAPPADVALLREPRGPAEAARRAIGAEADEPWLVVHAGAARLGAHGPAVPAWRLPPGALGRTEGASRLPSWGALLAAVPGALEPAPIDERSWARVWLEALAARPDQVEIDAGARVHRRARLVPPVYVGPGCEVAAGATVGPGVALTGGVHVGKGATLVQAAVLPGTRVAAGAAVCAAALGPRGAVALGDGAFDPADGALAPATRLPWHDRAGMAIDRVAAGVALIALSPLLLAIAAAIRLDSPGPALFSQPRAGQAEPGRPPRRFRLWKFRTMAADAPPLPPGEADGPFHKPRHDPRVTRLGRLLRATSLDELPQLFNVLRGDMRLVGNRPLPLHEAEALDEAWHALRFEAPAGLTGLWQVSGRSELAAEERLILDNYYAAMRTPWLDLRILAATLPALVRRRGAY